MKNKIKVSGIAPASTDIDLYIDGERQGRITSLKNGSYSGEITTKIRLIVIHIILRLGV